MRPFERSVRFRVRAHLSALILLTAVAMPVSTMHAQAPAPTSEQVAGAPAVFEAASIKVNTSGAFQKSMGPEPGGRFRATNVPLRDLLAIAYGIPPMFAEFRIAGGPAWMDSARFDVAATADRDLPPDQFAVRVRALLAERMRVTVHWETKDLPIYALVFASSDRALGPQLRSSSVDCAALRSSRAGGVPASPGPAAPAAGGSAAPSRSATCTGRFIPGAITGIALTLDTLANTLGRFAGRLVQNRTGLSGAFDYELTWTPEQIPQPAPGVPPPAVDPNGPSLFTAIREQLGLKLEPQRAPIDVLVVDDATRPGPD